MLAAVCCCHSHHRHSDLPFVLLPLLRPWLLVRLLLAALLLPLLLPRHRAEQRGRGAHPLADDVIELDQQPAAPTPAAPTRTRRPAARSP